MKKPIITLVILMVALLSLSCDSYSDDNGGNTTAPLAAKWNINKVGTIIAGREILTNPPQNESGCAKDFLQFNDDNTVIAGDYSSDVSPCALSVQSGTYVKTGNTLTTVIDGQDVTAQITNLTDNELKIKNPDGAILVFVKA